MTNLELLQQKFNEAFEQPKLAADRVWNLWVDLEITSDLLAGPLYNISTKGNCDYIYTDQDGRFPGVKTADDFRKWALRLAEEYRQGVDKFVPANPDEAGDRERLLRKAEAMRQAAELAFQIQKARENGKRPNTGST